MICSKLIFDINYTPTFYEYCQVFESLCLLLATRDLFQIAQARFKLKWRESVLEKQLF